MKDVNVIKKRIEEAHKTAKEKGWHDNPREFGTLIALIHTEVSEALTEIKITTRKREKIAEELADVLIRLYDCCGAFNIPLHEVDTSLPQYPETYRLSIYDMLLDLHWGLSLVMQTYRKAPEECLLEYLAQDFFLVHEIVYQIAKRLEVDLDKAIEEKMEKNKARPYRHGGRRV